MSDFVDSEAEESGEDLEDTREDDERHSQKRRKKGSNNEDDDEDDIDENEVNDIIDDNPIDDEEDDEESEDEGPSGRKRKHESEEDDEIDDDDLDLIQENTGIKIKKKKHSRVKILDSDDDDDGAENEADQIAHDIFDENEEDAQSSRSAQPTSRQSEKYTAVTDIGDESEEEGEDYDDFIVDDDNQPIKTKKKRRGRSAFTDSALQEAQDIFGLEFDLSEFDPDAGFEPVEEEPDENADPAVIAKYKAKQIKRRSTKKSIYQIYEPSDLEKGHLTLTDSKIRIEDAPERFQIRAVPVKRATDPELDEEAEWIYKQAFMELPISQQNFQDPIDPNKVHHGFEAKPVTAIPRIRAALSFMRKDLFEVPFIATYRKEYIEPELKRDDLWKIYEWDEKYLQFVTRRENMKNLFKEMQNYQFEIVRDDEERASQPGFKVIEQEDIDKLDTAQNIAELMDYYLHFQVYHGNELIEMKEWRRAQKPVVRKTKMKMVRVKKKKAPEIDPETGEPKVKEGEEEEEDEILNSDSEDEGKEQDYELKEIEVTDSEPEQDPEDKERKLPKRRDLYTICKDNGLFQMGTYFGLTPEQFGENLRDNYQRHETEQHTAEPLEAAQEFVCNTFPTPEAVLSGARHMLAYQISRDPVVKQTVRQIFFERAKIQISPTKKGKKEIDEFHPASPFKYLKYKPVRDLSGEQFLKMCQAEQEKLVKIKLVIDGNTNQGMTYLDEIKQLFYRDEYSNLVQEWNKQRSEVISIALNNILYPMLAKELKSKLLQESVDFALMLCGLKLRNWISVRPYQPDTNYHSNADSEHSCCPVLSCSFTSEQNEASFLAMIDSDGQVVDFLRLKYLLWRRNSKKEAERINKEKDMEKLKSFIIKHQPRVVAVAAESRESTTVVEDITRALQELEQEQSMSQIYVELVDGEAARIYQDSPRAVNDFPEYPSLLRHAISIARRLQDPLEEFTNLLSESEEELLCLRFHPLQEYLPKDRLARRLEIEFINVINEVGVDINRALEFPHSTILTHYICGLGPRKANHLLKTIRQNGGRLDNRSQLVTVCEMGLQVFLNCAGFIRIEPSDANDDRYEVLDGTRIHPETYDWPRKMAVDSADDNEVPENPTLAVEEVMAEPGRLKDLDLDAFAEELARQGYGNKQITLYDIRDELSYRFKDHRPPFSGLESKDRFQLLTGETPQSFFYGKMITCLVTGFAFKKATREELDSANPTRNDETSLWKCPFCLGDSFPELSEVWTHFDNGSCPGQAIGVRTRLDNGISGFISNKNISDKGVRRPEERVRIGMTLHARIIKINFDRFQVDLTCKTSDLTDTQGKFASPKDLYYDQEASDKDKKHEESVKQAFAKRTTYLTRVIAHPSFKNVTFKDAEKLLETMSQGDCIVRPSSKGCDHLTVTWKILDKIYQHIDIREEGKENDFSIGKSLWIDNEEYEDLDEIMARHISPMASHAREILTHKYYRETDGTRAKLEEVLMQEKRKTPGRIPYFFSCSKQYAGKFMLGYMPRNKPRVEYVSITPDGFRYRGRVHGNINNLLKWFKEHFRDPVPGARRQHQYGHTPMSMSGSVSGTTPYTPGATPSNLITEDEANNLMQQYQQFDNRATPAYSTSGFTPSSNFGDSNFTGHWGGTPRTPKQQTPQQQNYQGGRQFNHQRGNKPRHHQGGHGYHKGGRQQRR